MREVGVEYPSDWAQVDSSGNVVNVISSTLEQINARVGDGFVYVQSSDERPALMGGRYFDDTDTFAPSAPFDSWTWDEAARIWNPPTPKPSDETWTWTNVAGDLSIERDVWVWDEDSLSWIDTRPA
jgi:hypothetical protein